MMKSWISKCVVVALVAPVVTVATQKAEAEDDEKEMRRLVGLYIGQFAKEIYWMDSGSQYAQERDVAYCRSVIEEYSTKLKPEALMRSTEFVYYPGEQGGATRNGDSIEYLVPFKRAKEICNTYEKKLAVFKVTRGMGYCASLSPVQITDPLAIPEYDAAGWIREGEECAKKVDAALAAGVADDLTIAFDDRTVGTLAEMRTIVDVYLESAKAAAAQVTSAHEAARQAVVDKYKKVGIKGDRLELFVSQDGSTWYGRGCEDPITSLKTLKKAKKLFQIWQRNDGSYKVEKYKFKGDRYTVTAREFWIPERAYDWCK